MLQHLPPPPPPPLLAATHRYLQSYVKKLFVFISQMFSLLYSSLSRDHDRARGSGQGFFRKAVGRVGTRQEVFEISRRHWVG